MWNVCRRKPDSIRYNKDGREYYFCSKQCLDEFMQPEKELKKAQEVCCYKHSTNNTYSNS